MSTKIPGRLTGITVSDIHFGVGSVPAKEIAKSLREVLFENYSNTARAAKVDVIMVAGDVFHDIIDFGGEVAFEVQKWWHDLMTFAAKHDILLLLLRGTYSHDREQCEILADIANNYIKNGSPLKFFFYNDVAVVNHLGYDMLFVPDNHAPTTDITLNAVKAAMASRGLDKVDLAFMHGTFRYQLKYGDDKHKHDEYAYLDLVRHWIMSGHIHNRSVFSRIIAQGSWPRTSHGEEETKGAVWWRIDPLDGDAFEFIDNTQAKIFTSLRLTSDDLNQSLKEIDRLVGKLPEESSIQIVASKTHPVITAFNSLKQLYPFHRFKKKTDDLVEVETVAKPKALSADDYVPPAINRSNIVEVVVNEVLTRHKLTPTQQDDLQRLLRNIKVK